MDQEMLKLLTKLKIMGKRIMGLEIDIIRLNADRPYAALILEQLSSSEDEELVMSSIEFMGKLGLVKSPSAEEPAAAKEEDKNGEDPLKDKYVGRLR